MSEDPPPPWPRRAALSAPLAALLPVKLHPAPPPGQPREAGPAMADAALPAAAPAEDARGS
jgi:hypothetical protein